MKLNFVISGILLISVLGCQTAQQKNLALVKDRATKLRPLSKWRAKWCRLDARLTQPVISRYRSMYPQDGAKLDQDSLAYTWKARESSCEITALEDSPMVANHKAFLDTAICTLLQTHWVNSPFDELQVGENDIVTSGPKVQVKVSEVEDLGLFLDRERFSVVTKTKSRGVLEAVYMPVGKDWLPQSISQRTGPTEILIDQIEYSSDSTGDRPLIRSFWLSLGGLTGAAIEEKALAHTQVNFSECRDL